MCVVVVVVVVVVGEGVCGSCQVVGGCSFVCMLLVFLGGGGSVCGTQLAMARPLVAVPCDQWQVRSMSSSSMLPGPTLQWQVRSMSSSSMLPGPTLQCAMMSPMIQLAAALAAAPAASTSSKYLQAGQWQLRACAGGSMRPQWRAVVVTSSQQAVQLLGCGLGHTILTSLAGWQAGRLAGALIHWASCTPRCKGQAICRTR